MSWFVICSFFRHDSNRADCECIFLLRWLFQCHHLALLYLWLDDSLRFRPLNYLLLLSFQAQLFASIFSSFLCLFEGLLLLDDFCFGGTSFLNWAVKYCRRLKLCYRHFKLFSWLCIFSFSHHVLFEHLYGFLPLGCRFIVVTLFNADNLRCNLAIICLFLA